MNNLLTYITNVSSNNILTNNNNIPYDIYIINEIFTNGLAYNIIIILSVLSVLCAVSIIINKNPIVSVLFLIGLFLNISCYLMMLGYNFIGLSYLLVYVGAVSILFLFILMLINIRISELSSETSNSLPLGIFTGVFFNLFLSGLLPYNLTSTALIKNNSEIVFNTEKSIMSFIYNNDFYHNSELFFTTSQLWDGALAKVSHITSIGNILYTNYPLWLILTSLILLLAMVGTIVITIKSK
jgi:NADH-ubiquinone oxidoreductase chain 6